MGSLLIKGLKMPNSGSIIIEIRPHGKIVPHTKGIGNQLEAIEIDDVCYEAFVEFERILIKKIENQLLYGS